MNLEKKHLTLCSQVVLLKERSRAAAMLNKEAQIGLGPTSPVFMSALIISIGATVSNRLHGSKQLEVTRKKLFSLLSPDLGAFASPKTAVSLTSLKEFTNCEDLS